MTTTIEWHNAKAELPEKSGEYLVYKEFTESVCSLHYSHLNKAFDCYDWCTSEQAKEHEISVLWWAEAIKLPTNDSEVASRG